MENYNDIVSSVILGCVLVAIIIPLIAFYRHTKKEKEKLDEVKPAKKGETPQQQEFIFHP